MKHTNRLTIVERTDSQCHRSHIIIHSLEGMFIVAEFDSVEQLDFFANTVGFTYTADHYKNTERCGIWREYKLSHKIDKSTLFWNLDELPEGVKPIKALCNGSIVTCYYLNDGETIFFYRPNPNAKTIYHPLSIEEHISHRRTYGSY